MKGSLAASAGEERLPFRHRRRGSQRYFGPDNQARDIYDQPGLIWSKGRNYDQFIRRAKEASMERAAAEIAGAGAGAGAAAAAAAAGAEAGAAELHVHEGGLAEATEGGEAGGAAA